MNNDRAAFLAEAQQILSKSTFTKEDSSKVENLIRMADAVTDKTEIRGAVLRQHDVELGRKPAIPSRPDPEFSAYLKSGLEGLPEEYRLLLLLVADEQLSYDEIAELTGQSTDAVRGKLHRARKAFAAVFPKTG